MVALALGPLEAAALALLRMLGVAVVGGAVADEVAERQRLALRERQQAIERIKATPVACTAGERSTARRCEPCMADTGLPYQRNFPVRQPWVEYQARIGGMPNGPTFIVEWAFNGVMFDGFDSSQCLLKEAKGQYDHFFDDWGQVREWWRHNVETFVKEISAQSIAARPRPPIRLEWFWQQPLSYRYFSTVLGNVAGDVPHHYHP
jgi:hypothetical protein